MFDEEDYYEILGVHPNADAAQIKEAYVYKVNIYHPDRLQAVSDRIRRKAEEDLKKVNIAYEMLSNPERRRQYDVKRSGSIHTSRELQKTKQAQKPQPEVYPKIIRFKDVLPYVKQKDTFFIRNVGGPYSKVLIGKTPEWIKIVETVPLQRDGKLPMRVEIEAIGIKWGEVCSSEISVRLDETEAKVKVELNVSKGSRRHFWKNM